MNDDELSERLRLLVDRAQPVDLDEVIHRRPVRSVRPLVVALAGVAVLALVAGAVALLRIDRHDPAPITTDPPATTVPADPPDTFEDARGWIAFRDGEDLLAVDPANPADQVSIGTSHGADPIGWSVNGTRLLLRPHPELIPIFFDGGWGIGTAETTSPLDGFVLNADGSRTRLTDEGATWGSFSPDGTRVVYASTKSGSPSIIDADGGRPRSLGAPCPRPSCGGEPFPEWAAWAPDGSRIAFVDFWENHPTYGAHAYTLSFLDPDTGDTLGNVIDVAAAGLAWSPDGSQLAFWAVVPDEDADPTNATLGPGGDFPAQIFVINADGSGLRQVTQEGDNRWPTWSPDGSRIAFGRGQLTLMTARDGSQAAYVRAGSRALFTMASDGTDVQGVEGVSLEGAIAWNPVP